MKDAVGTFEAMVFEATDYVVSERQSTLAVVSYGEPIKTVIKNSLLIPDDPMALQYQLPTLADLYKRGIIDFDLGENAVSTLDNKIFWALNELEDITDRPSSSEHVALGLASLAFTGVLLRPKNTRMKPVNGPMHKSHLSHSPGLQNLADIYRHRRNLLYRLSLSTTVSKSDMKHLRPFITDGELRIDSKRAHDVLTKLDPEKHKDTARVLTRLHAGSYAARLLPLFELDCEDAEYYRDAFIDRGFDIVRDPEIEKIVGQRIFDTSITAEQERHILSGDKKGGGHHIPSLNGGKRLVSSEVEYIHAGVEGSEQQIPVALVESVGNNGNSCSRKVETFFPSEWSAEETIDAIKHPVRLVYEREENGRITQYCHARGVLFVRIIGQYHDSQDEEIITAYPAVHIPRNVERKLLSQANTAQS